MVILCAATMTPRFGGKNAKGQPLVTQDGLEACWGINYLANFHLLSILSPALRAQPPDRDVRILIATCSAYIGGQMKNMRDTKSPLPKGLEYSTSKLALMTFATAFQKHLDSYTRPDKMPNNARVIMIDPGTCRTPGTRRWLSLGSVFGLFVYVLMWPLWWIILKDAEGGSQSFLTAAMEATLGGGLVGISSLGAESKLGGSVTTEARSDPLLLRECREVPIQRAEVRDGTVAKELWAFSEKQILALEKESAVKRALAKKEEESKERETTEEKKATVTGKEARTPGSRRSRKG
jgi:NAD(P)-dependent dehydrogenase (short-subunit alcohol dehydrogenase family)